MVKGRDESGGVYGMIEVGRYLRGEKKLDIWATIAYHGRHCFIQGGGGIPLMQ